MTIEILSDFALLKISGADAGHFLQGQLTNDVVQLGAVMNATASGATPAEASAGDAATWNTPKWQLSAYCNPKGRVLALFYLWKQGDDFFAVLDRDLVAPISNRLRMFVLRSKVTIEHLPKATMLGVPCGDMMAESILAGLELDRVQHGNVLTAGGTSVLVINSRILVVDPQGLEQSGQDKYPPGANWLRADIDDGIPHLCAHTSEMFLVQMLNLDLLGGISFKKGCYTGQEIVARMHYLGNLKQRMFSVTIHINGDLNAQTEPQPADKVFADPELGKSVGNLVSVQGDRALAVLRLESITNTLFLQAGASLRVDVSQPYELHAKRNN